MTQIWWLTGDVCGGKKERESSLGPLCSLRHRPIFPLFTNLSIINAIISGREALRSQLMAEQIPGELELECNGTSKGEQQTD